MIQAREPRRSRRGVGRAARGSRSREASEKNMRQWISAGAFMLAIGGPAFSAPITVDGHLGDWSVSVADNNASSFAGAAVPGALYFASVREDTSDTAGDSFFLGPYYGGQNYDVEFMAVALSSTHMYLAIVTGQRPDNGLARYSPGDIRIVGNDGHIFGVEVGGGAGGGAGGMLTEGAAGSTYTLNSSGYTVSHASAAAAQLTGSIWRDPSWILDPIAHTTPVQMNQAGGTFVGTADFVYTRDAVTTQHAIIELSIARNLLGSSTEFDIYWAPSCSNDILMVHDDVPRVDAPGTTAIFALGLACMGFVRRVRRR